MQVVVLKRENKRPEKSVFSDTVFWGKRLGTQVMRLGESGMLLVRSQKTACSRYPATCGLGLLLCTVSTAPGGPGPCKGFWLGLEEFILAGVLSLCQCSGAAQSPPGLWTEVHECVYNVAMSQLQILLRIGNVNYTVRPFPLLSLPGLCKTLSARTIQA